MRTALAVAMLSVCAIASAQEIKTAQRDLADEIGSIDLKAGVTEKQAGAAALFYCEKHISGCGTTDVPVSENSDWQITPRTGIDGSPDKDKIIVGKHSGKISWGKGPITDLLTLVNSKEPAPTPVNGGVEKATPATASSVKIEFTVSPDGRVSDARFKRSSKNVKCDLQARTRVESWKFPPRTAPVQLVTTLGCGR
ncbi:TonB family protein [Lysobacter enzymogenes]|nr:TonB family protein [Lysobacter enzymogenes]QCW24431.1 TonB family protein [Lysobacter enzymogenes]